MKILLTALVVLASISSFATTTDKENFDNISCTYNGASYPVNTIVGGNTCTTKGTWDPNACRFDGYERPEKSRVGPYKCEEGEWINKLGFGASLVESKNLVKNDNIISAIVTVCNEVFEFGNTVDIKDQRDETSIKLMIDSRGCTTFKASRHIHEQGFKTYNAILQNGNEFTFGVNL